MAAYGSLCTEFYDLDKPAAPGEALDFYFQRARHAGGRVLEPMCGSGRFLLPMSLAGVPVDGVDSSPAMLEACRARSRELAACPSLFLQDLAFLELPHRYRLAFIPSGSIGLITEEKELQAALSRIRAHLEPNSSLLLELVAGHSESRSPAELDPRAVLCADGSSIAYTCRASRSTRPNTIRYLGTYTRHNGTQVVETQAEALLPRLYDPQKLCRMLENAASRQRRYRVQRNWLSCPNAAARWSRPCADAQPLDRAGRHRQSRLAFPGPESHRRLHGQVPPPASSRSALTLGRMVNTLRRASLKALAGVVLAPRAGQAQPKGEQRMPSLAKGTFTVEMKPQAEPNTSEGVSLGRMSLDKQFQGDLVATGKGEMLTALTPTRGSAGYVAIERVTGTLQGRSGSFVFQHSGTMDQGTQRLSITVVPGSGTGALAGLSGAFKINITEGMHFYEFEYSVP